MKDKGVFLILIFVLVSLVICIDQGFKPKDIEGLRKIANQGLITLPPKPFTTDGCSLWLNSFLGVDYTDICIEHDMKYWKGGSAEDRKKADNELKNGVNERIPLVGSLMYMWVRAWGHPAVPVPWRWGYGFDYLYVY